MLIAVALSCLIVDDNSEFLETARHLLDREGIDVTGVATNSAEAIKRVADLHPDVVLVDVHLAEEDGVLLARRIVALGPPRDPDFDLSGERPGRDVADGSRN